MFGRGGRRGGGGGGLITAMQGGLWESQAIKEHLEDGEEVIAKLAAEKRLNLRTQNGVLFLTDRRIIFLTKGLILHDELQKWDLKTLNIKTMGIGQMTNITIDGPEGQMMFKPGLAMQSRSFVRAVEEQKSKLV